MADISNNAGAAAGNQKLGRVTVGYGEKAVSGNTSSVKETDINSVSSKYDDRFDEVNYYE